MGKLLDQVAIANRSCKAAARMNFEDRNGFEFNIRGPITTKFMNGKFLWYALKRVHYIYPERVQKILDLKEQLSKELAGYEGCGNLVAVVIHTPICQSNIFEADQHVYNFRFDKSREYWIRMDDTNPEPVDLDDEKSGFLDTVKSIDLYKWEIVEKTFNPQ